MKIIHGDALTELSKIPSDSIDLVFADPPYNIGKQYKSFEDRWPSMQEYLSWCKAWLTECIRVLKPTGSLYVMASTEAMPYLDTWLRERIAIRSRIVWCYDSSGVQAKKYFGSLYEPILFCVMNPKRYTFNADDIKVEAKTGAKRKLMDYRKNPPAPYASTKVPGNVWNFSRVRYKMPEYEDHPTQKPEALLERIILASSNVGDTVLDPFAGTFTTGAVAQKLGRDFIGIELIEDYVEIGIKRLNLSEEE